MGRIMSFGQDGRMVRDFDKSEHDFMRRYGKTPEEVMVENAKLREFTARLANALGIDSEWCDTSWCDTDCMVEFGCQPACCGGETRCPAWEKMRELGIEVSS